MMPAQEESLKAGRSFTPDFQESAVLLAREQGDSVAQATRRLGGDPRSIRDWEAKLTPQPQSFAAPAAADAELRQQLERLRAENWRLLREREIVKPRPSLGLSR